MVGGDGIYNVNAANTNRTVRFSVESAVANAFVFLRGNSAFYPHTSQVTSPTANQRAAQERADAVVRVAQFMAPVTGVKIVTGSQTASMLILEFETAQSGYVFINDLTETVGITGTAKVISGLQTRLTALVAAASLDGGSTLLFAVNPTLQDGTTTTAAAIAGLTVAAVN